MTPMLLSFTRRMFVVVLVASSTAFAHEYKAGEIRIDHPHARASLPGQTTGAGFLALDNKGATPDRLLAITSAVSSSVELHTMSMEGDVMRMRQVDAIEAPARQVTELRPGGYHIMFINLKAPLKAGTRFPATLRFEKAGDVEVVFNVEELGKAASAPAHNH